MKLVNKPNIVKEILYFYLFLSINQHFFLRDQFKIRQINALKPKDSAIQNTEGEKAIEEAAQL